MRMNETRVARKILDDKPGGKRTRGRPRRRWLDDVEADLRSMGVKRWRTYRIRWSAHLQRMDNSRFPKQALLHKPRGRRYVGRPRKRWTADVGTGDSPIP
jgi:hypothetical protein